MRKTLSALSMAVALASGSVMADEATLNALKAAGVQMSPDIEAQVLAAEGAMIADAIAAVVSSLGDNAEAIAAAVGAAISASPDPDQTGAIVAAAVIAAPTYAAAIKAAATNAAPPTLRDSISALVYTIVGDVDSDSSDSTTTTTTTTSSVPSGSSGSGSSASPAG
ncbi:hypothetical protein KQ940_19270 [Marinobacterium sp. D7]|uniref:hypothetical protein n=1 Tax=Marinobacterium ramblicola TaxID=2849041 RepID=UPI001C2CDF33|nr:hypothetical protein [Marinobacterium ramblicola]MBV1790201.1 hypothetical protein [Marinobacterium ramblicola]